MYGKKLWLPRGEGVGGDKLGNWDRHIHTTTCKQIIDNKLLYSTRNSTQQSVMSYMGKESKKEWM